MYSSILAGMLIAMGCITYLTVGGILGAFMFSFGLLAILRLRLDLYTDKIGLLVTNEMNLRKLVSIYAGNLLGTGFITCLFTITERGQILSEQAYQIVQARLSANPLDNLIYAILCGMLMSLAVTIFERGSRNPIYTILAVAIFIVNGFAHSIADSFYFFLGVRNMVEFYPLISVTLGNFIGCYVMSYILEVIKYDSLF